MKSSIYGIMHPEAPESLFCFEEVNHHVRQALYRVDIDEECFFSSEICTLKCDAIC
jgi:hypothetical protein